MSNPKHVVRSLLRAIRKHVTSVSGNPQWRDYAVSQCRIAVEADAVPASQRLRVAENLAFLINNVHLHNVRGGALKLTHRMCPCVSYHLTPE